MKNSKSKIHHMATRAVWSSLIICACLLVGTAPAFAQEKTTTIDRDTTYGEGGKKTTRTEKWFGVPETETKITDGKGVLREKYVTRSSRTGNRFEAVYYYDCKGQPTYLKEVRYGILGNEQSFEEG